MSNAIGPDVSFWQDDNETPQGIDFQKMKANGASFVIIRAGQNIWPDPDFATNWANAKAAGLLRGSYWFYDDRRPPDEQAQMYLDTLAGEFGELPLWVDIEQQFGGLYWGASQWKRMVEKLLYAGADVGIYTAYYVWKDNTDAADRPFFASLPLWVANYEVNSPAVPPDWLDWLFWQYTSNGPGPDYGVESKSIDLNYFNGDEEKLHTMFGGGTDPPPNGGNDNMIICTNNVSIEVFEAFGEQVHAMTIPPSSIDKVGFHYTPGEAHLVEDHVNSDVKIFWNFTPYVFETLRVKTGLRISGTNHQAYTQFDPWLEWNLNNEAVIDHVEKKWKNTITASQGFRYIFQNGAINSNPSSEWSKRFARTIVANDGVGSTIVIVSTGDRPEGGLTLHDVADIFGSWVASGHGVAPIVNALDADSGHSSQIAYMLDGEKKVFTGPDPDNRNLPPCFGYVRLKTPLITEDDGGVDPPPVGGLPVLDVKINVTLGDDVNYHKKVVTIDETLEPIE